MIALFILVLSCLIFRGLGFAAYPLSPFGKLAPRWSADGKWISYWNGAQNVLFKRPISIRNSTPVFDSERNFVNGAVYHNAFSDADYSLSRDGRVLVNRVGEQSTRLTLVSNWIDPKK